MHEPARTETVILRVFLLQKCLRKNVTNPDKHDIDAFIS